MKSKQKEEIELNSFAEKVHLLSDFKANLNPAGKRLT
jgi:hypothetical protein